jgi:hypothetical protein
MDANSRAAGKVILEDIGEEVLDKNLHMKMVLSSTNEEGKTIIPVAGHARWDKHGSGRMKDSLSDCLVFTMVTIAN